jgi:O-antigen ligase
LSAVWSDYPDISVRRCFGLILPAYCLFAAMAAVDRPERVATIVYAAFWAALVCNLLSLPLPSAFDEFGFLRGITAQKNILGCTGALAILSGLAISPLMQTRRARVSWIIYLIGWSSLLVLSVSKTSIALVLGVPMFLYVLRLLSICLRIGVASSAALLVSILLGVVGACYAVFGITLSDLVPLIWHDATFTGRTQLWDFMLDSTRENWMAGVGFGSFWAVGSKSPHLYAPLDYIRLTNQAHNGYLDLLAALGLIGVILVLGMLAHALQKTEKLRFTQPWLFQFIWFILLFAVIHNLMESSLLVPFAIVWHMTLLAYLLAIWASQVERS